MLAAWVVLEAVCILSMYPFVAGVAVVLPRLVVSAADGEGRVLARPRVEVETYLSTRGRFNDDIKTWFGSGARI